jgi:hypothetical protein
VTVVGLTSSADFANVRAPQKVFGGSYDAFVSKFKFTGASCLLINSTFLGGTGSETATGVALDALGNALVVGYTSSYDFPTQVPVANLRPFQSANTGLTVAFAAKIGNPYVAGVYVQSGLAPQVGLDYARDLVSDGQFYTGGGNFWGNPGDIIILGDWTHSGKIRLGAFHNGVWILDTNGNGVLDGGDRQFTFGQAGDIPVVGDWDGTGTLKAGLFRGGTWILDLSGHLQGVTTTKADLTFSYGLAGDTPIAGDWTGTGTTRIGVFRGGFWILDANGDYVMNSSDPWYVFGQPGDTAVTGDWDGSGVTHPGIVRNGHWVLNYQWANEFGALGSSGLGLGFSLGSLGSIPVVGNNF